ncbi:solute carrier family 25 (mitochondrial adenine nucleotide translocator), member 4/5/6/31 [Strigomonas culicis]|uniref:Solute carrier family 25 (Mitochondrial adenine nucleotide translocator), member 4/5/6/31 n=1 Tax=Strigomonas culicis TaxID=28005 RepID=S9V3X6_9TRYP|nr:solute carrier family 25 (mitochondrial adenine nucleotide translocator), member 4/5/6/31 [Strigomonas culicis]|eukprot:EPY35618.1 solute carrier family 25 (mitochondrial adenine nucleotide translocator), member 4/5/6/31 [Strigomonas culicis]
MSGNTTYPVASSSAVASPRRSPPPHESQQQEVDDGFISIPYIQQLCVLRAIHRTILAPLDRVKYVMQCQKELQRLGTLRHELPTTLHCARHLLRMEGARSFWRGNLIQVVSVLPVTLAHLFIMVPTQSFLFSLAPTHSAASYTMASYLSLIGGALAASMVSYPLEFARFRLAVDVKAYKTAPYEFRHTLAFFSHPVLNECPHYLYRGLGLFVLGSLVFKTVHGALMRVVWPYVPPDHSCAAEDAGGDHSSPVHRGSSWMPALTQISCGLCVATVSTLCLHPVDLVRRRLMVSVTDDRLRYKSAWQCVQRIAQREGIRGFYRGSCITLLRMAVGSSLVLAGLSN